eukprot:742105-Prorocentrum_lima.AAC.1
MSRSRVSSKLSDRQGIEVAGETFMATSGELGSMFTLRSRLRAIHSDSTDTQVYAPVDGLKA